MRLWFIPEKLWTKWRGRKRQGHVRMIPTCLFVCLFSCCCFSSRNRLKMWWSGLRYQCQLFPSFVHLLARMDWKRSNLSWYERVLHCNIFSLVVNLFLPSRRIIMTCIVLKSFQCVLVSSKGCSTSIDSNPKSFVINSIDRCWRMSAFPKQLP